LILPYHPSEMKESEMMMARSYLRILGAFAMVGSFAGCGGGGPEAFAPGSTPAVAPASAKAHEPLGPGQGGTGQSAQRSKFKQKSYQTEGPQEQP
jgi:hypothetical protein